jgi:hypothetical protein
VDRLDWNSSIGGTPALLACIPGLGEKTLWAWRDRGRVEPRGRGTGHRLEWTAADALRLSVRQEFSRLNILPAHAEHVWTHVAEGMIHWQTMPGPLPDVSLILCIDPQTGGLVVRLFKEADEDGAGLDHRGAPPVFVVFRVARFIERVAARIEHMRATRSGAAA